MCPCHLLLRGFIAVVGFQPPAPPQALPFLALPALPAPPQAEYLAANLPCPVLPSPPPPLKAEYLAANLT